MIDAISSLAIHPIHTNQVLTVEATESQKFQFIEMLESGLDSINRKIERSEDLIIKFSSNEAISTHEMMIAIEDAKLAMHMAVEIRNKLLESYSEITRMQV